MRMDDTVLYEQFVAARCKAVELTDTYRETSAADPMRVVLWDCVVRQTELARGLLESWLRTQTVPNSAHVSRSSSSPPSNGHTPTANKAHAGR